MKTHTHTRKPGSPFRGPARLARFPAGPLATPGRVREVLYGPRLQAKLTVGPSNDAYEREADRVADAVMRMPEPERDVELTGHAHLEVSEPSDPLEREADQMAEQVLRMPASALGSRGASSLIQRKCARCEEESRAIFRQTQELGGDQGVEDDEEKPVLHLKSESHGARPSVSTGQIDGLQGEGTALSPALRSFFEPRFGANFANVRVHTGRRASSAAHSLRARAFTLGNDIAFGAGQYAPSQSEGMRLIAHELAHVVQQNDNSAPRRPARLYRMSLGTGATPRANFIEVPADERARVNAAIAIVRRVATNPRTFPACRDFFRDNCPGGSLDSLRDTFDQAVVWKRHPNPEGWLGSTHDDSHHIAYTNVAYDVGRWAIAATLVHELIHVCGQADHDIGDRAKRECGNLPDI